MIHDLVPRAYIERMIYDTLHQAGGLMVVGAFGEPRSGCLKDF